MTRERIKDFKEIILPFFTIYFLKENYEGLGKSDAEEFEKDFNEILNLAAKALEQQPYEKFESAKDHIYKLAGDYKCWDNRLTEDEAVELCHILEQQPCEDKIIEWKKDFKEYVNSLSMLRDDYKGIMEYIDELPVTPIPKTGQWVLLDECSNSGYYCSECHKKLVKEGWSNTVKKIKYCPNCGAKMINVPDINDGKLSEIPTGLESEGKNE